jgi:flagellar biosynthesis regulator FlaF
MSIADPYREIDAMLAETRRSHERTARRLATARRLLAAAAAAPGSLATTATLEIDGDGQVWTTVASDLAVTDTRLGPVDDDATAERVPAALLGRFEELRAEWAEMTANRAADRDEAEHSYRVGTEGTR